MNGHERQVAKFQVEIIGQARQLLRRPDHGANHNVVAHTILVLLTGHHQRFGPGMVRPERVGEYIDARSNEEDHGHGKREVHKVHLMRWPFGGHLSQSGRIEVDSLLQDHWLGVPPLQQVVAHVRGHPLPIDGAEHLRQHFGYEQQS